MTLRALVLTFLALSSFALSACGLTPVYGTYANGGGKNCQLAWLKSDCLAKPLLIPPQAGLERVQIGERTTDKAPGDISQGDLFPHDQSLEASGRCHESPEDTVPIRSGPLDEQSGLVRARHQNH